MKKILLIITILLIASLAYSDEVKIPFSVYPKELQIDFAEQGKKLDLSSNDRTKDSWGFIDSKGSNFNICTYKPATKEDFNLIMKVVTKGESCVQQSNH